MLFAYALLMKCLLFLWPIFINVIPHSLSSLSTLALRFIPCWCTALAIVMWSSSESEDSGNCWVKAVAGNESVERKMNSLHCIDNDVSNSQTHWVTKWSKKSKFECWSQFTRQRCPDILDSLISYVIKRSKALTIVVMRIQIYHWQNTQKHGQLARLGRYQRDLFPTEKYTWL